MFTELRRVQPPLGQHSSYGSCLNGSYLYRRCGGSASENILAVFDVSDDLLLEVTTVSIGGTSGYGICTLGNYVYATINGSPGKIATIDISNPLAPSVVNTLTLNVGENTPVCLVVYGSYLFAITLTSPARLVSMSLSNPAAPSRIGAVTLSSGENTGGGLGISSDGHYAYVFLYLSPTRLVVVDVSTPASPARMGALTFNSGENQVLVTRGFTVPVGTYLYVPTTTDPIKLLVADVSNPSVPSRVGALTMNTFEKRCTSFVRDGANIYLPTSRGGATAFLDDYIITVDITNPAAPVRVGADSYPNYDNDQTDCDLDGNKFYLNIGSNVVSHEGIPGGEVIVFSKAGAVGGTQGNQALKKLVSGAFI